MEANELNNKRVAEFADNLPEKHQLIFELGYKTGLRVSDIISLKKDCLAIEKPTIREIKTGKPKRIYIPSKLREKLIELSNKSNNEYIFCSDSKSGHISRQAVFKAFKKTADKTGIKDVNIATHTMRKTYACNLFNKGYSVEEIQQRLNHRKKEDTIIYIKGSIEDLLKTRKKRRA